MRCDVRVLGCVVGVVWCGVVWGHERIVGEPLFLLIVELEK